MKQENIAKISYLLTMQNNKVYLIEDDKTLSYLCKTIDGYYVAIPYSGQNEIQQKFVGFEIITTLINYDNVSIRVLSLFAENDINFDIFSTIAADFIDIDNRERITKFPFDWIDGWRNTLGDSIKKSRIYDVIGELVALKECFNKDRTFMWEGPKGGTHDLVAQNKIVEVKSSTNKTENIIHVNSSYQLRSDKPLYLYFVRLESKPYALTINSLVDDLVAIGYPKDDLEKSLTKEGYPIGDRFRNVSYDLLEIVSYEINKESYPVFSLDEINKFAPKKNIIGYELTLDLANIDSTNIYKK